MAIVSNTAVSLRFAGDDLEPDELTLALRCQPDRAYRKGDAWTSSKGTPMRARTGIWAKSAARRAPGDLDSQVNEILATMTDDLELWRQIAARFGGEVFCGLFLSCVNEGIGLRVETLAALALRGLGVVFDIYGGHDEKDSS